MNISAKEYPILHLHDLGFHLSHQPSLCVVLAFLLHEFVLIGLNHVVKSQAQRIDAVDGSNESLGHADEELDTLLRKYSSAK